MASVGATWDAREASSVSRSTILGPRDTLDATRTALRSSDGDLTYGELADAVDSRAQTYLAELSPGTLIHLPFNPTPEAVVSYLAALSARLPLLLTAAVPAAQDGTACSGQAEEDPYADLLATYKPAATIDPRTGELNAVNESPIRPDERADTPLHPDIALLLATSGSTGSKKLVKLSLDNLRANASAIAHGLGLTAEDCAPTLLPLHYSFGLSVLNSHLISGATIAVGQFSVADPSFAGMVEACGVTNIGVVPHMLQLLRTADGGESLAHARLVYQAGGKLDPEDVTFWREHLAAGGTDFRVMYGQTEATARMTIMPSELMEAHPEAAGVPLAGHEMRADTNGELVFSGPSVMLGYAESPADLRVGRTITELRTGDVGEITPVLRADGTTVPLVRITGRASDFLKLAGLRISCEQVRLYLAEQGISACVTGDDTALRVAADVQTSAARPVAADIERALCARTGLSPSFIRVVVLPVFPLLDNGKIDRRHCAALADAATEAAQRAQLTGAGATLVESIARALAVRPADVREDLSFVDNGGSSLSFVPVAMAFAEAGVELPTGWHHIPLGELLGAAGHKSTARGAEEGALIAVNEAGVRGAAGGAGTQDRGREQGPVRGGIRRRIPRRIMWLEPTMVLRAICAITIVLTHATTVNFMGGAHSLLVIAGVTLGGFGLTVPSARTRLRATARSLIAVALPTIAVVLVGMAFTGRYGVSNLLFIHWYRPSEGASGSLWFIESYLLGMVLIMGVLAIPPIYRFYQRQPFVASAALTALLLVWRFKTAAWDITQTRFEPPGVIWFIAAGIMISQARTRMQKIIAAGIIVAGSVTLFEYVTQWLYVMIVCAIILSGVRLPVPRAVVRPVGLIASASLYIYLIQFDILDQPITEFITVPAAILAGIGLWKLSTAVVARGADRRRGRSCEAGC